MNNTIKIYEEERPWGRFRKFVDNSVSTVKIITVSSNKRLSLQSHKKRAEFWKVISGSGVFEIDGKRYEVKREDEYNVPIEAKHRIEAGDEGMAILEIATGEFDENDITRYEDDYNRA